MVWTQKHIQQHSHCNNTSCIHHSSLLLYGVSIVGTRFLIIILILKVLLKLPHDPHHHRKMWAYHHGLEVRRVVGLCNIILSIIGHRGI